MGPSQTICVVSALVSENKRLPGEFNKQRSWRQVASIYRYYCSANRWAILTYEQYPTLEVFSSASTLQLAADSRYLHIYTPWSYEILGTIKDSGVCDFWVFLSTRQPFSFAIYVIILKSHLCYWSSKGEKPTLSYTC